MSNAENSPSDSSSENDGDADGRRDFLAKAGSVCAGCALVGVPVAASVAVALDPLRKGTADADFVQITSLDSLPADGTPQKFTVKADHQDAWSRFPNRVIGAVYLRRLEGDKLQAFNVVCPHLGCAVEFREEPRDYFCPCHNSSFDLAAGTQEASSPSARGLDELETEVRGGEVWVRFQNFVMGIKEKRPV